MTVGGVATGLPKPIEWPGGKGTMLARLLPLLPYGPDVRVYVEAYCGGASLFFAKRPHPVEVLNDLDERVVTLFRVLQDERAFADLRHRLLHTPYARAEFRRALEVLEEGGGLVETAWALFVVANQAMGRGMSGVQVGDGSWSRNFYASGGMSANTNKWLMRLSHLDAWHRRLLMAQIDCRDALEVIRYWDTPETVFYLDPPYVPDTIRNQRLYMHMADLEHHRALVETLLGIQGMAILSAYAHPVYAPLEGAGWERRDWETAAHMPAATRRNGMQGLGNKALRVPRVESVYLSPRLLERLGRRLL